MNNTKKRLSRRLKRHDKQIWTKAALQELQEIRNSKYCGTDKTRRFKEIEEALQASTGTGDQNLSEEQKEEGFKEALRVIRGY